MFLVDDGQFLFHCAANTIHLECWIEFNSDPQQLWKNAGCSKDMSVPQAIPNESWVSPESRQPVGSRYRCLHKRASAAATTGSRQGCADGFFLLAAIQRRLDLDKETDLAATPITCHVPIRRAGSHRTQPATVFSPSR